MSVEEAALSSRLLDVQRLSIPCENFKGAKEMVQGNLLDRNGRFRAGIIRHLHYNTTQLTEGVSYFSPNE